LRGTHPDLLVIEPLPPSHIIRLAAVTGGDESLSIQQLFRTPPLSGRNKVAIVSSAERMNADAANAFLKTLEEPPTKAKVILTSASPGALLPTILSRCMACACELPSREELAVFYPEADDFTLRLANGAPGRVRRLLASPATGEALRSLATDIAALVPRDSLAVSERLRAVSEARDAATGVGMRRAQADTLAELGIALRVIGCHGALTPVAEAHRRILGNGNATLVFDQLFTGLACTH
jgi:DNA polymerase-3 subunit delta'